MHAFNAGTLAGAGSFRCGECGFAVALHERDEVPACPNCGGDRFERASLFATEESAEPTLDAEGPPEWIAEAREALGTDGSFLAYNDDDGPRVVALSEGWTRIGRSLAADVRLDDPTVSRRHALVYCDQEDARVLDDRSLNGVFHKGERVELSELADGDEIAIGRFHLYFLTPAGQEARGREGLGAAIL